MRPSVRKGALALHLIVSIGWLGALLAYLALDVTVATGNNPDTLRASYIAMDLVATRVIVPLAFATLVTGLVMALGTPWGLVRHYWVIVSLVMTLAAIAVLLVETRTIAAYARAAMDPSLGIEGLRAIGNTLVHSVGGLVVLGVVLVLNLYKPRGLTRYGQRKRREEAEAARETP